MGALFVTDAEHLNTAYPEAKMSALPLKPDVSRFGRLCPDLLLLRARRLEDGNSWFHCLMNSYQQTGKSISVRACAHMPLGFFETHDTAEHVFHSEGQKHLRVRFELGQIDNDIRLCGVPGNFNLAVRLAYIQHHRIFKRRANNIKPLLRYVDFVHFYDALNEPMAG